MFISKDKHILSHTMMIVAVVNFAVMLVNGFSRLVLGRFVGIAPDMLDETITRVQFWTTVVQFVITILVFFSAHRRIVRFRKIVPVEDEEEMMRLQREMIPDGISTLSMKSISCLVYIWAAILIGVQLIYELTSVAYRSIISQFFSILTIASKEDYLTFVSLYNATHGLKYLGMLIAINIGIFTSGLFLNDKFFKIFACLYTVSYMVAFLVLQQSTIVFAARAVGVVWTSVIFHVLQTVGIFVVAFYMKKKYRGI